MFSGWTAFRSQYPARVHAANAKLPFLVHHGDDDEIVLPECAAVTEQVLRDAGVPATFKRLPMGHCYDADEQVPELAAFLRTLAGSDKSGK